VTQPRFQGHGVIIDALDVSDVLCAQLTRDLFATAEFLLPAAIAKAGIVLSVSVCLSVCLCVLSTNQKVTCLVVWTTI